MKQIKKTILTLVALLAVTTGAWAQDAFGVKEIVAPADWENDETNATKGDFPGFDGITIDQAKTWTGAPSSGMAILFYNIDGETISYVVFYDGKFNSNYSESIQRLTIYGAIAGGIPHYYTASAVPITWDAATKTATIASMPAGNVTVNVEYYPGMLTLPASLTGGTLSVEGLTAPFTKLDVPATWENDNTLLSAAHLPGFKEMTDDEAKNWTDVPGDYVILIYGFDGTNAKTVTYIGGEIFGDVSSEDVTLSLLKTASADAEIYYSSEAQMPAGFETDGKNIFVADKTEFKVKATPADGFRLVSLMFGEQDITDQVDADGIATLTMPEGNIDLELTATFAEITYNVTLNTEGLSEEEAAKWKGAAGEDAPQAFPLEEVKKGQTVTVTYTGSRKVIGVKAEKKAAAPATVLSGALVDGAIIKVNFKWRGSNDGDYVQGVYNAASGTFTVSNGGGYWSSDSYAVYKVEKSGDNIIIGAGYYDYSDEAMVWTFNTTNDTYTTTNGTSANYYHENYGLISVTLNGTDITSQLTAQ